MKKLILTLVAAYNVCCLAHAHNHFEEDHFVHTTPFTPEEEEKYFALRERQNWKSAFDYTSWNECARPMTGNYSGHACARSRRMGEILYDYLDEQLKRCLVSIGQELDFIVDDFHLVHAGIFGDPSHSSRSLHAVGRAIDVKDIRIHKPDGTTLNFNYSKDGRGKFFQMLRSCWGKAVHEWNSCPVLGGRFDRTASVGKENGDHQHHLHLSVPYCVAGAYSSRYFRK